MKTRICNNCGGTIGLLARIHLFKGKGVCGKCILILDPKPTKPKINYAKIAVEAVDRATVQVAEERITDEDARYEHAKRRCVFFFSSFIWVIQLVLWLALFVLLPMLFLIFAVIINFF